MGRGGNGEDREMSHLRVRFDVSNSVFLNYLKTRCFSYLKTRDLF